MKEPPPTAANNCKTKVRSKLNRLRDWFKRPQSAKSSASQPNSNNVPVSLAPRSPDGNSTSHQDPQSASENPQTQDSDWKAAAKEGLGVASRFTQTLLKTLPDCVDTNPVKMAFSIARMIINIKDSVEGSQDQLAQHLRDGAKRLLAVERNSISKAAEQPMEEFRKSLGEEMKNLENLSKKSLATRIFDHGEYANTIQQIFHRINEATTTFQLEMAISIRDAASQLLDEHKKTTLLRLHPSKKADHQTVLDEHEQPLKREECTPGTRVRILEDITKWANDSSSGSPRVFWLTGQAGSGKSTIAYTIAKSFEKGGDTDQQTVLGGNFLCSRQFKETRERIRIIPTIAYQLACKCKSYADALHVADKFDAVDRDIFIQLKDLFVGPWEQSEPMRGPDLSPYLIVIDALDEVNGDGGLVFLRYLLTAINEYDLRGFKFLVTSRSDLRIVELCKSFTSEAIVRLQDVPIEEAELDIKTYLEAKLEKLVGNPELDKLKQQAQGLFIYAATAVKYLTPHFSITFREQMDRLSSLLCNSYESTSASNGVIMIDELYRQIMHDTFSKFEGRILAHRLRILYTFLCTAERTSMSVVTALDEEGDDDATRAVAEGLHAVLYTQDDRVFWYHASFPDFIFDPARSNFRFGEDKFEYSCNEPVHHNRLGGSCFRVMKSGLRFNIGDISSSFLFDNHDHDALTQKVNNNISAVLKYSCHHWAHHLRSSYLTNADNLCCCISDFLQIRVLFWIEAMNLLKLCNQCTPMLQDARRWVFKLERGNRHSELAHDILEATDFATYFSGSPAAKSTPHLYISALATWPRDTSLYRKWKKQFARIPVFTHTGGRIDLPLMTVRAGRLITAVAFSSDGTQIVSGSRDGIAQVWDASTGAELMILEGHTKSVNSVVFSSNVMQIVSGSDDKSVRVWDASTGAVLNVLRSHTGEVTSVAFSSHVMRIVSGSRDGSLRVWNASTGAELNMLKYAGEVTSVAFSSDGTRIVSGSRDGSVRVWNVSTGEELNMMTRYAGEVTSVAFSSNGERIVSASGWVDESSSSRSWDVESGSGSVWVWDALRGAELNVLKGHIEPVTSVAFTSDDMQIMSGSVGVSVWIWDASTGAERIALQRDVDLAYMRPVVALLSDGTRILSGSQNEIKVWDVSVGAKLNVLPGHTDSVNSVAFSKDGKRIVSGSSDGSVRVWDACTGAKLNVMNASDKYNVMSVAFSSDSTRIVSGSYDWFVRIWDASTGVELNVIEPIDSVSSVSSVAFSSNGMQMASGSHDGPVQVWDASTGAELSVLKGHTSHVSSVAFSSDGTRIVSSSWDECVRVWDVLESAELNVLKGHTGSVNSVAFSSDGMWIVSGSSDRSVRVWDVSTGVMLNKLEGHTKEVTSVMFSSDSTRIVSGSWDASIRVWDVSTGAELHVLKGHTDVVGSVAFSNDGTQIVSGSDDNSVRVWNVSMGEELKGQTTSVNLAVTSSDCMHIVSDLDDIPRLSTIGHGCSVWSLAETNWIVSCNGKRHLMWVPQEAQVTEPSNICVISCHGFGSVDFQQSMIGDEWAGCYTP